MTFSVLFAGTVAAQDVNFNGAARTEARLSLGPKPQAIKAPDFRSLRQADGSKLLPILYGTFAGLQALDMHSTAAALRNGAVEANPVMQGEQAKVMTIKALSAAASIGLVHTISKKNKKAGIIAMIALNAASAYIVAHNYGNARR